MSLEALGVPFPQWETTQRNEIFRISKLTVLNSYLLQAEKLCALTMTSQVAWKTKIWGNTKLFNDQKMLVSSSIISLSHYDTRWKCAGRLQVIRTPAAHKDMTTSNIERTNPRIWTYIQQAGRWPWSHCSPLPRRIDWLIEFIFAQRARVKPSSSLPWGIKDLSSYGFGRRCITLVDISCVTNERELFGLEPPRQSGGLKRLFGMVALIAPEWCCPLANWSCHVGDSRYGTLQSTLFDPSFVLSSQPVPLRHRRLAFHDIYGQSINSVHYIFPFQGWVYRQKTLLKHKVMPLFIASMIGKNTISTRFGFFVLAPEGFWLSQVLLEDTRMASKSPPVTCHNRLLVTTGGSV